MKVKTEHVPKGCDYLTAGKVYEAEVVGEELRGVIVRMIDDRGGAMIINVNKSIHLGGGDWTVIDEEAGDKK